MNRRHTPLTSSSKATALQAGMWQQHDGTFVSLRKMHDAHLINALLQALNGGSRKNIILPLTAEVVRRGLEEQAMTVAEQRSTQ